MTSLHAQQAAQQGARPAGSAAMEEMHQAVVVAQHGDEKQALVLADRLVEQHPSFMPGRKLQCMLLEQTGRGHEAAGCYEKALQLAPEDAELLFHLGVYELVAGNDARAVRLLEHHLKLKPRDGDGYYYLAQAYHLSGENKLALDAIRSALKLDGGNAAVWQKYGELLCSAGDNRAGLLWLTKAKHADSSLERIDYDLGVANFNSMNFADALGASEQAVRVAPGDGNAHALLASTQVKLGMWADAQVEYERILSRSNEDGEALLGLGHCQLELKEYEAALDTLHRVVAIDPTQILAHYYLSRAYNGLGNKDEAAHEAALHQRLTEEASAAPPGMSKDGDRQIALMAEARQLLMDGHEEQAHDVLARPVAGYAPTRADAWVLTGVLYRSMGQPEAATRALHRALEVSPKVRGAHTNMGIAELQQGEFGRAESEFNAELANDPNYAPAIAELGELRYRQQRWADAAAELARSKTAVPGLLYMLCDAYFHLQKVVDAKLTAEVLAAHARDDAAMMESLVRLLNRNEQTALAERIVGVKR